MHENIQEKLRAVLVCVLLEDGDEDKLTELELLATTADYEVIAFLTQKKEIPDKRFFLGKGKLEELNELLKNTKADIVIFDNDISGSQFNTLENYLGVDVIDRAELILEIFARHATSNEGKLQVELARKKHSLPRVLGQGIAMSRQGGGGGGSGGARRGGGEQKLELDKRTIKKEIQDLSAALKKLSVERDLRREKRRKNNIKTVAIVGYTNAGKSTLMNAITKANVLEENKLFATLDPVSRKVWLGLNQEFLLIDTVGFISRLPHEFIEAFRSTLEETKTADLLLLVVDGASIKQQEEYDVVRTVLFSLGVVSTPIITIINKSDSADFKIGLSAPDALIISAKKGYGTEELKAKIANMLFDSNN